MTVAPTGAPRLALVLASAIVLCALVIVVLRGGLIGWSALILGLALLAKRWWSPSARDPLWGLCLLVVSAVLWGATYGWVISSWESGEVVTLDVELPDGSHRARVWVMDVNAQAHVYFDAPVDVAEALLAGEPLKFTRDGVTSTRVPNVRRLEDVPTAEVGQILAAMQEKYAHRYDAAGVYYLLLGRYRDREAIVIAL
ncbi:MAG: hypothetical protein AAF515_11665 [Pseudomonadota bacterium]